MDMAANMSSHANDDTRPGTPPPSTSGRAVITASRHEVMSASDVTPAATARRFLISPSELASLWKEPGPPSDSAWVANVIRARA